MVFLEDVKDSDFGDYMEEIKKTYSEDVFEIKNEEMITFGGKNEEKITISLNYIIKEKTMGITVTKEE